MSSVLEILRIKKQPLYTSVSQLGIHSELSSLQIESEHYFTIGKGAQAADGNVLAVSTLSGQEFRTSNQAHIEFINKCTGFFKQKSMQLKSIDQKLAGSVAFGVAATALSFLPGVGFLGWIGWAATAYFINQRATAYAEYHEALTLLVGVCNWSLGSENRRDAVSRVTKNEAIRNMMAALYPVLTETQVKHLIADDIEQVFTKELEAYEKRIQSNFQAQFFSKKDQDDTIALSKKGAEFSRCIYGFNKGGVVDFLDAIVSLLPDLYKAAVHGIQQLKHSRQEKINSPENEVDASQQRSTMTF
ncbi:hypothetical protein [Fluoribacter dumoffii]|uniref:Uncharacterized protein n=1 Tax=Fluoribacter dumoffii TaxID=463 RepID=A0A377GD69_9GAMM|nr:hypothetical protein [Fluoribacter dumoffii]KTC91070.1 hypothetical protein Ldum_2138 [Fluoribacter dumoffii NY 23]STO22766.1 Uncharacterised protein [Fluoribacter dumoffii]